MPIEIPGYIIWNRGLFFPTMQFIFLGTGLMLALFQGSVNSRFSEQ